MKEISGMPCSGKTSLFPPLNFKFSNTILSVCLFPFFIFLCLFHRDFVSFAINSIFKDSRGILDKLNFIRNFTLKLLRFYCSKAELVDEGVTHLPFNLGLVDEVAFLGFCEIFSPILKKVDLVYVYCDRQVVISRLNERGHRRLRRDFGGNVERFVDYHLRIQDNYLRYMASYVAKMEFVDNS